MPVEVVVKDACFTVGEGPHWDEASKSLFYVDIYANSVSRWDSVTKEVQKITLDNTIGFVIPSKKGGVIIGLGQTISRLEWDSKKVTVLHEVDQDKPTRFNDGKCDARGRLWAGTVGMENPPGIIQKGQGSLYSFDKDGSVKKHLENLDCANGLAWSADNKSMYFIDSIPRCIYVFDYDINSGTIKNQQTLIKFEPGTESILGVPDGMTMDTDGKLWVAFFFGGRVVQFDPDTGKSLSVIHMPAHRTSSCCFGGPDYAEMFVTCSRYGCPEEEISKYPLSGSVFKVTDLGAKGNPPIQFEG